MKQSARLCASCCVLLAASIAAGGCGAGAGVAGGRLVASVGGARIGKSLLDHWIGVNLAAEGPGAFRRTPVTPATLGLLIAWQWTLGESRATGVRVSDAEAKRQLALSRANLVSGVAYEWFPQERAIQPFLASRSVSARDQLWVVRLGMLAGRLGQRRITLARRRLTHGQIVAYYRSNMHHFRVGERRDIEAIMSSSKRRVIEAKREMRAGVPFHLVAARFNESKEGGLRLGRARGSASKQYERDFFAAPPHVLIGPRKEILYYIFEVLHVRPGYQETVAQAEPAIRARLAEQEASGTLLRAYERKWRARTRCGAEYLLAACGEESTTTAPQLLRVPGAASLAAG
jgi:hypothetical protein